MFEPLVPTPVRFSATTSRGRPSSEHQYTIVKEYMRSATLRSQEMFVPLTHAPGEAQADFGEATVVIAVVEQKAHYLQIRRRVSEPNNV